MLLEETAYTIFDVETTGLYPYSGDKICEIGAVRMERTGERTTFQALLDPQKEISKEAFKVNGITGEMVAGKPTIDEVLPDFLDFIKGSVLVAYNAGFDLGFLASALGYKENLLNDFQVIDALKLARKLFPGRVRYNLDYLAETLGINTDDKHRALADAVMTAEIFRRELDLLKGKGTVTVEEIAETIKKRPDVAETYNRKIVDILEGAISGNGRVNITYKSIWNDKMTNRDISPLKINKGYDNLYVTAYCYLRKEERNFRLDCITEASAVSGAPQTESSA